MNHNSLTWFEKTVKNYQKSLEIKILNIYILEISQKQKYIDIILKIDDLDLLFEIDYKLSGILKNLWDITIKLLSIQDKNILIEFFGQIKWVFEIKDKKNEIIDLSEIDENIIL